MKLSGAASGHLSYCTNVHPGEGADDVLHHLSTLVSQVKSSVSPDSAMGVGLRVAAQAASEFQSDRRLDMLRQTLAEEDLYVYTVNGFPFGNFHRGRVKEKVYLPDWRDPRRLRYTIDLARLLAAVLPEDVEYGSISTVPCGFRSDLTGSADLEAVSANLLMAAAELARIRDTSGKTIVLALEPEPCCHLETVPETIAFFERWLYTSAARARLMNKTGMSAASAELATRRHLAVCLDLCHLAVEFESPRQAVRLLTASGVSIAKVQISAGLRVTRVSPSIDTHLAAFDDGTYLHQVVERIDDALHRYVDLPDALASRRTSGSTREWRIHFHVPVFASEFGAVSSTRAEVDEFLALHRSRCVSQHLEVETYTWNVLPAYLREPHLPSALARELEWVRSRLLQ